MHGVRPADEDRLPWLEPYRESKKPGRPLPRRGYGRPIAIGAAVGLLLAVGAGGYWLGQQRGDPFGPQPSDTIALPAPRPQPIEIAEAPAAEIATNIQEPAPEQAEVVKPKPAKKATARKRPRPKKIRSAGTEQPSLNAVRAAQERRARQQRQVVTRSWPKMPSPGPAGQVIQLGAFTTVARASNAYQERVARYPLLAGMPRVIVPVITKPDGRVLYVLRLGTTSRQQSKTVCGNLRKSGDHCLVIG